MRTIPIIIVAVCFALVASERLHSQGAGTKLPVAQLQALQVKNKAVIDRQTATLQKLDEVEKEAAQLKFFSKRS